MPRYTIDFGKDFDQRLSQLAKAKGTTKAEIIRRAVATYAFLAQQTEVEDGIKVSITDDEDQVLKDVILP